MKLSQQRWVHTALLVVVWGSATVLCHRSFSLHSCATNRRREVLTFADTSVSPHPIVLPGDFSVSSSLRVFRNVTGDITLDVTIQRQLGFFWLRIPCVNGVGSCRFSNVCGLLRNAFRNNAGCPPQFIRDNVPCTCPLPAGTYTMDSEVFHVDQLIGVWSWLIEGDYRATARLVDNRSGEEIACQQMDVSMRNPSCTSFFCRWFG